MKNLIYLFGLIALTAICFSCGTITTAKVLIPNGTDTICFILQSENFNKLSEGDKIVLFQDVHGTISISKNILHKDTVIHYVRYSSRGRDSVIYTEIYRTGIIKKIFK